MDMSETGQLVARITSLWKIYDEPERRILLVQSLQAFDSQVANDAIDRLIKESKTNVAPSIDEIVATIRASATFEKETGLCRTCENLGWYFVDTVGHGSTVQCECRGRFERKIDQPGLTSEGKPIASPDEKREAILKGFLRANPEANEEEKQDCLAMFGMEEIGLVGAVVSDEIF